MSSFELILEFQAYEDGCESGVHYDESKHDKMRVVKEFLIEGPEFIKYVYVLETSIYCNCICLSTFCSVTVGVLEGWVSCARKPLKMNCSSSIYTRISMLSTW